MRHLIGAATMAACFAMAGFLGAAVAAPPPGSGALNSANIAAGALSVARRTDTTGHCYAAVSQALHPLGVDLHGSAAYQAYALLMEDQRFLPVVIDNIDQLRVGDIIVYQRSPSHPYGHISVYAGDYMEASDHVAPVAHTSAYGGATVFRLRDETLTAAPVYQPLYNDYGAPEATPRSGNAGPMAGRASSETTKAGDFELVANVIRRRYKQLAGEPIKSTLLRTCKRMLLRMY